MVDRYIPGRLRALAAAGVVAIAACGGSTATGSPRPEQTPSASSSSAACQPDNPNMVTVYSDPNFQGRCASFPVGDYDSDQLGGVGPDDAESIIIGGSVTFIPFKQRGFGSGAGNLTGPTQRTTLHDELIGNNQLESLRVR